MDPISTAESLMATEYALCAYNNLPNWYGALLESEAYRAAVNEAYQSLFTDAYFENLLTFMKSCQQEFYASWRSDLLRWSHTYPKSHQLNPADVSFSGQAEEITDALRGRLAFLKTLLYSWEDFCLVSFRTELDGTPQGYKLQLIVPKSTDFTFFHSVISKSLYTPEGYKFVGLCTQDGTPMEDILTVTEDLPLFVRFRPISSEKEAGHE